jgi:hypothetical protein
MNGVFYILSIVAVYIVIIWFVRNSDVAEGSPTRGLLAIKQMNASEPKKSKKKPSRWSREAPKP